MPSCWNMVFFFFRLYTTSFCFYSGTNHSVQARMKKHDRTMHYVDVVWMSIIICVSSCACNHHDQHPLSVGLEALSLLVSCYIVGQTGLYVCVFALCWLFQCFPLGLFLLVDSQVYHHQCSQGLVFGSCLGHVSFLDKQHYHFWIRVSCNLLGAITISEIFDFFNHRGFCFFASLIGWAQ